jgi:glycosyltransferase involved in cell wall biosynthesis
MANGCVLVASDTIGSSPYLIKNGINGFMYHSASPTSSFDNPDRQALKDLIDKVVYLLDHREVLLQMKRNAREYMQKFWTPKRAAENLIQLIDDLKNGRDTSILEGPCSKA